MAFSSLAPRWQDYQSRWRTVWGTRGTFPASLNQCGGGWCGWTAVQHHPGCWHWYQVRAHLLLHSDSELWPGLLSKKITSFVHSCVKIYTGTRGQSQMTFWSLMHYLKTLLFCMNKQGLNLGIVGFLLCSFLFNCCFLGHPEKCEQVCQTWAEVVFVFVWWQFCRSVFTCLYVQVPTCPIRNPVAH